MDKKPDENQNPTLIPNSAESINSDLSTNDNKKSVKNKGIQKPSKQNGDKTVSRSGSVNNKEKKNSQIHKTKVRHEQQQQQQPKPQREKFQQPQQNASNQHQRQYTENNTKPQNFPQRGYSKKKG